MLMTQHHLMVGSYGSSELTTKIFVDYYLDCLFFYLTTQPLVLCCFVYFTRSVVHLVAYYYFSHIWYLVTMDHMVCATAILDFSLFS